MKAISFTATLTWRHLRAEPARLPLLAFRLLPTALRRRLPALAAPLGPLPRAYAQWDAGRREQASAVVRRAARTAERAPRKLARLAAFAIAVEQPSLAEQLLAQLPEGPRRERLARRLALKSGRVAAEDRVRPFAASVTPPRRTPRGDTMNTRVLHLVTNSLPHTNAGYTQRTHRIVVGQRAAGMEPHVLTRLGYPLNQGIFDLRTSLELDGVSYHRLLPWTAPADGAAETRTGARLAERLVRRLRPDLLHAASNHRNAEVALELGRRSGLPVVYEVRGFLEDSWLSRSPDRSAEDAFYVAERERETESMMAADLVVTLGEAMRTEIAARGVPWERIMVAPNAVDEAFLRPLPDASDLRAGLGIPPGGFVAGTTTSCYGYEGLDVLLAAVRELRLRGVEAHALIVGDGPELPVLRGLAPEPWAHFPGRVPGAEVRRYHAALDVFAVPRRDERVCRLVTPLKPVEAMAGGLPVVASDLPALREIVEPGVTGELIPPDDSARLADRLEVLAYARSRRMELGLAARRHVSEHRTWTTVVYRYTAGYSALLGKSSGPGHSA